MIPVSQISTDDDLFKFSNPHLAQQKLRKYLDDKNAVLFKSTNKNKKYMILVNGYKVHFGQIGYEDFTKHGDEQRRQNYLKRTENIRGNRKENKYSPNFLSRNVLW
jgi:hypothetical protein